MNILEKCLNSIPGKKEYYVDPDYNRSIYFISANGLIFITHGQARKDSETKIYSIVTNPDPTKKVLDRIRKMNAIEPEEFWEPALELITNILPGFEPTAESKAVPSPETNQNKNSDVAAG